MRIIPAIDILNGKCVRLTQGDYSTQKVYSENPLEVAKQFEDFGIQYLHVVDLDGAKAKEIKNAATLQLLASRTKLEIDFGGGIKSEADLKIAFDCGAKQVTVGSVAAQKPSLMLVWMEKLGTDKIILGADCKMRMIATNGWLENSSMDVVRFISAYEKNGMKYAVVTDIDKDGMLEGPSFELYEEIRAKTNIKLIASGGISSINDILRLKEMGCEGAIIGKALYEGTIELKELSGLC